MTDLFRSFRHVILLIAGCLAIMTTPASPQGRFSPVLQVGDSIVTRYELDQRTKFLSLLGAPGDPRVLAREQLISEAIQRHAARESGLETSPDEMQAGMEEFAGRANLSSEQFLTALEQNGVDAETFRDFIGAGVAWRSYVRDRFGESARDFPQELISRTLAKTGTEGGLRVLVSEILLPANTRETAEASRARAQVISGLDSETAFAASARELSVAASSTRGGELNWAALETLPENIQRVIRSLTPGQISRPVELENAIGVFLLRDVERVEAGTPDTLLIDYALFKTDGDLSAAERILGQVDVCDDLYGIAKGLPADRLIRETKPITALPADIRDELERLDLNETSTALTHGGKATILMLCERRTNTESTVDFEIVGTRLLNTKLGTEAANHLAELRANTIITDLSSR